MLYQLALAVATATPSPPIPNATPFPVPETADVSPAPLGGLVTPAAPAIGPYVPSGDGLSSGDIPGVEAPFVGLALADAISMALSHNTDLAISQSNRRIAGYEIVAAKGAYDVTFMVQPTYAVSVEASTSSFQAGPGGGPVTQITAGAEAGFQGLTTTGGQYRVFTSAQRIDNNFVYNSYDPYYETALGFTYAQPLARNAGIDANRRQLILAKIASDYDRDAALLTASNTLDSVLIAYYNLVAAWKNLGVSEDALRAAKEQQSSNERLAQRGAGPPVDVAESGTQVAEFQGDVYSGIANVASLQNQLKSLLLSNPADPLWTANIVPITVQNPARGEPTVRDLVSAALVHRPEVAELRESMRQEDVNVAYQKDQTKPQIDLNLGVTENGFAGAANAVSNTPLFGIIGNEITDINALIARSNAISPGMAPLEPINPSSLLTSPYYGTIGKLGESFGTALRGEFPQYSISATLSFPIRNRTAEGNYRAELERRSQLQTQEVALIQRVEFEARNAVAGYRSAHSRVIAAGAARRDAEIVAASEQRKFRAGASTTFLVLQRLVALANARTSELQAQTDEQRALVELQRVDGSILTVNALDIDAAGNAPQAHVPSLAGAQPPAGNARLSP